MCVPRDPPIYLGLVCSYTTANKEHGCVLSVCADSFRQIFQRKPRSPKKRNPKSFVRQVTRTTSASSPALFHSSLVVVTNILGLNVSLFLKDTRLIIIIAAEAQRIHIFISN